MTQRLARGLDFLLSGEVRPGESTVSSIPVDRIRPNPHQPRDRFVEEDLADLTASIRVQGVLQPVIVRRSEDGYELVAGERRWRASQRAGLTEIPAVLRDVDDNQMLELALVENIQRSDLGAIEIARGYATYMERLGLTQEEVGERMGRSRSAVANAVRLLELPQDIQDSVSRETISAGHARALLGLPDAESQRAMLRKIVTDGLSVRATEKLVKAHASRQGATPTKAPTARSEQIVALEATLRDSLQTRVRVDDRGGKGRIVIDYFSVEDLDRLLQTLAP